MYGCVVEVGPRLGLRDENDVGRAFTCSVERSVV